MCTHPNHDESIHRRIIYFCLSTFDQFQPNIYFLMKTLRKILSLHSLAFLTTVRSNIRANWKVEILAHFAKSWQIFTQTQPQQTTHPSPEGNSPYPSRQLTQPHRKLTQLQQATHPTLVGNSPNPRGNSLNPTHLTLAGNSPNPIGNSSNPSRQLTQPQHATHPTPPPNTGLPNSSMELINPQQ